MANHNPILNLNQGLGNLPANILLSLKTVFRVDDSLQSFIAGLDGPFTLSAADARTIERSDNRAHKLVQRLVQRNMTMQQFVDCAARAQLNTILEAFQVRVPLRITRQPFHNWNVMEGEALTIEIEAFGSPHPVFQWFQNGQPVPHANSRVLHFPVSCVNHSGKYICQVRNADLVIRCNPVGVNVSPAKPLKVKLHPRSYTSNLHGDVILRCEVWGDIEVVYQWLRNGKEIADSSNLVGADRNELKIYNVTEELAGSYFCRISRGEKLIRTQDAIVQVSYIPDTSYTATDKVALLIGAEDYYSEPTLTAPKYDVQAMSSIFRSMNFKVVSLMNLTKKEMIAAIHEFSYLIGEGVYCVFYFAGHGFEAQGQCFLLPHDAPQGYDYTNCLSAHAILFNAFLPKKPKFCCMILDICRLTQEGKAEKVKPALSEFVMCYATSLGYYSYEQHNSGILVSHLKKILQSPIGVDQVFINLKEEIKEDPVLMKEQIDGESKRQAPEVRSTLSETKRSFHDPIDSTGYTEVFKARQLAWERAHCQPNSRDIDVEFPGFKVTIRLDFQAEYSNELIIFTSVIDPGQARICRAFISEIPADVADKAKSTILQEGTETSLCKSCLQLHNLQRLKIEMVVRVAVICVLQDNREVRQFVEEELGWPLISRLSLWREYPNPTVYHEPEERE